MADKICDICQEAVYGRFKRHITCSYNSDPKDLAFEDLVWDEVPDDLSNEP